MAEILVLVIQQIDNLISFSLQDICYQIAHTKINKIVFVSGHFQYNQNDDGIENQIGLISIKIYMKLLSPHWDITNMDGFVFLFPDESRLLMLIDLTMMVQRTV